MRKLFGPMMVVGGLGWFVAFGVLLYNVWSMRGGSASPELWVWGAAGVFVSAVLCGIVMVKVPAEDGSSPKPMIIGMLVAPFAISAFFWVTMVHPTASDEGQTALGFFGKLAAKDYLGAHEMLSAEQREKMPADSLPSTLPAEYITQRGASVNAISSGIGTVVGDTACVDGWLTDENGDGSSFAMGLVLEEDGLRIGTPVRQHNCGRH